MSPRTGAHLDVRHDLGVLRGVDEWAQARGLVQGLPDGDALRALLQQPVELGRDVLVQDEAAGGGADLARRPEAAELWTDTAPLRALGASHSP